MFAKSVYREILTGGSFFRSPIFNDTVYYFSDESIVLDDAEEDEDDGDDDERDDLVAEVGSEIDKNEDGNHQGEVLYENDAAQPVLFSDPDEMDTFSR